MKTLPIILSMLAATLTVAVAQDTNNQPEQKKDAPQVQRGERRGPQGPMFRGGRNQQGPVVSPNDRQEEWDTTLAARRDEFRHQLNPNGPYPGPRFQGPPMGRGRGPMMMAQAGERGPRGPMFRGGRGGPEMKGCCQCQCHQKQQRRNHGRNR